VARARVVAQALTERVRAGGRLHRAAAEPELTAAKLEEIETASAVITVQGDRCPEAMERLIDRRASDGSASIARPAPSCPSPSAARAARPIVGQRNYLAELRSVRGHFPGAIPSRDA